MSYLNLREHTLNRKPSALNMVSQRFILSKTKGMLPWTIIFVWASLAKEVFTQHYKFFLSSFFSWQRRVQTSWKEPIGALVV